MSEEILEALTDFATAIESAAVDFKQRIAKVVKVEPSLSEETFLSLVGWTKTQGERLGEFEYCTREANKNSDVFNRAFNILKANDATIKDHFGEKSWHYWYWIWPERGDTIYRKSRKEPEPKAEIDVTAAIRAKFPENLSQLLSFESSENYVIIKPRQYLGSENFAKIASIVREASGEYISAGKESHFRIKST